MKTIITIILIGISLIAVSQEQRNIVEYTCTCINDIPENLNQSELIKKIQDCYIKGYEEYEKFITKEYESYLLDNSVLTVPPISVY